MPTDTAEIDENAPLTEEETAAAKDLYRRIERAEAHIHTHRAAQRAKTPANDWLWINALHNLMDFRLDKLCGEPWKIRSALRYPPAFPPGV
jgi:hypothetical protein